MASRTFIDFYRKTDVANTVTFTDTDGNAYDCTGGTLRLLIKENFDDDDADALLDESFSPGGVGMNVFSVVLTNAETDLTAGEYYEGVQFTSTAGIIWVVFQGRMSVMAKLFE